MLFQDCLCFALTRASRRVAKVYREKLDPYGLTQPQFFLLIALYEEDGLPITALAEKVALDKSTLTGLLDRVERDGLVERVPTPEDRRALQIRLTPKAEALRQRLTAIYDETNAWFLSQLTAEERETFDRAIAKLESVSADEA
ncbi:MAG: MarR family transcriptional regulator [Deltaproteobacteria bacterium]|nr:MarR family transcriptional regulator [Deltaproteobacteria bacterium]